MTVQSTSSQVYYNEIAPNLGSKQLKVLEALRSSKRPVNNQELSEYLGQPINTITPRVGELVIKGLVRQACKAVYPKTNRKVIYWEAV